MNLAKITRLPRPFDADQIKGLDRAILVWQDIADGNRYSNGVKTCPLCAQFSTRNDGCGRCPIAVIEGPGGCMGTPYLRFTEVVRPGRNGKNRWVRSEDDREAALAFLDYLITLRTLHTVSTQKTNVVAYGHDF